MSKQTLAYPGRSIWGANSVLKRELHKHSVDVDVKQFCGWATLNRIVEAAQGLGYEPLRNAGFIATLFECGGRVSETLMLKPSMFTVFKGCTPKLIKVEGMPLLKRYEKIGELLNEKGEKRYRTKRIDATRDFAFRVDEPLFQPMGKWLMHAMSNRYEWLFPSPYKKNQPLSRKWAYKLVDSIGESVGLELYPHWFRSQRASQLASEYEFREASLLEWFQWEKWETAKKYAKLGPLGLAKKMGVKFRKDRGLKPGDLDDLVKSRD